MNHTKFGRIPSKSELQANLASLSEDDFARFLYWQQISETFMAVTGFEAAMINAMSMCDEIKVSQRLGAEDFADFAWLAKRTNLQDSTIGNLIKILERHDFAHESITYLKWVKQKRDYFIHKHFQETPWPGDMDEWQCHCMIRRLIFLQVVLDRASRRIWHLFAREGLFLIEDIGDAGFVVSNPSMWLSDED